ncbi:Formate dehydrogenase [Pleurostoma richardsiae]|uniref:Formate dehydrogenase n=1 Tax=Pleurostoma richardsiae TaxID=41990 RepID=A0AA38RHY7_9PEZI|nr:Formate dehydrogenase [Pleurostoma richardsiae]
MSRKILVIVASVLAVVVLVSLTPKDAFVEHLQQKTKCLLDSTPDAAVPDSGYTVGGIGDKVAVLTDTEYTPRLIPLILHYHAILGPDWPIVFFTSEETLNEHLRPELENGSAFWRSAVEAGRIQLRVIQPEFDLKSRDGVNVYLSRPWLWEELTPARHVLVFQTDAILCANARRRIDDFLEWDFIGAPLTQNLDDRYFNGGLSLRNRTMMLDILREGNSYEEESNSGEWPPGKGGEDVWFSHKMRLRGGNLPEHSIAMQFSCEYVWHINQEKAPLGYHKIHKAAGSKLGEVAGWCPEISLTAAGKLV